MFTPGSMRCIQWWWHFIIEINKKRKSHDHSLVIKCIAQHKKETIMNENAKFYLVIEKDNLIFGNLLFFTEQIVKEVNFISFNFS